MEGVAAVVLFDLAFVAPPLAILAGILMLLLPSRRRRTVVVEFTHAA